MTRSPYSRAPLSVFVGGIAIVVPYRTAADWVDAAEDNRLPIVALEWAGDGRQELLTALARGTVDRDAVQEASRSLLLEAVPRPDRSWWISSRLLSLSARADVAGHLTLEGVDPHTITPAQLCSAVYTLFTRGMDAKDKYKFEAPLSAPPPGIEDDVEWGQMTVEEMAAQARSTPGMR